MDGNNEAEAVMFRLWSFLRGNKLSREDLDRRLADLRDAVHNAPTTRDGVGPRSESLAALFYAHQRADTDLISVVEARGEDSLLPDTVREEVDDAPREGHTSNAPPSDASPSAVLDAHRSRRGARRYGGPRGLRKRTGWLAGMSKPSAMIVVALVVVGTLVGTVSLFRGAGPGPALAPNIKVRVGLLNLVDVAALYQSIDKGYFHRERLDVETKVVPSGPDAIKDIATGNLQIAFSSYPGIFKAQVDGAADLKVIAPAYKAAPGHLMLVGPPDHSFTRAEQAPGKRIAVTSMGSVSDLGAMSGLKRVGVDPATVHWRPMDMPSMLSALQRGDIDGAVVAEPFVTLAKSFGAVEVLDAAFGLTYEIPMSGWAVTGAYAENQPEVIEAFQRALARGAADVQSRDIREHIFRKHLDLDTETILKVRVASYPEQLDAHELQPIADLMRQQDMIKRPLDVAPMLLPLRRDRN